MNVRLALALFAMVLCVGRAQAAWGPFTSLGDGPVLSDVSCAADGVGTAVCAAVGAGSTLIVNRYTHTGWVGWTHLPGVVTSAPSCSAAGASKVVCVARTASLALVARSWNGRIWSPPLSFGGSLASAPSCAPLAAGHVLCAARTVGGSLASFKFRGGAWAIASWTVLAPVDIGIFSPITCTSGDAGTAICAWQSSRNRVSARRYSGVAWSDALDLGGTATNPPACSDAGVGGEVACFGTGTDSALWVNSFAGGSFVASHWGIFTSLQGLIGGYSCAGYGQHAKRAQYVCGVVGLSDNGFWTDQNIGSGWTGWVSHGGSFLGNPSCVPIDHTVTPSKVMCVLVTSTSIAMSTTGP